MNTLNYKQLSDVAIISAIIFSGDSIGLSSVISLDPGGSGTTEFCLAWDMPIIKYKKEKKIHRR